jgi:uncharacterized repeat protein (TIGR01451 family)
MSIKKQNIKRRMLMVVALAMILAVLAAGTAYAGTRASTTLTNTVSADSVAVGDQVAFTITETNNESFAISPQVKDFLPSGVAFEQVTLNVWDQNGAPLEHSQGQCSFIPGEPNGSGGVECDIGTLPPGATAVIDVVVTPLQPGIITNNAYDSVGNSASESILVYPA